MKGKNISAKAWKTHFEKLLEVERGNETIASVRKETDMESEENDLEIQEQGEEKVSLNSDITFEELKAPTRCRLQDPDNYNGEKT